MKKRAAGLLLCCVILSYFLPLMVGAADQQSGYAPKTDVEITAKAVYLKNLDTGDIVYEKNADMLLSPASTTKVMTALLALEQTKNIKTEKLTYPIEVQNYLYEYQLEHGPVSTAQLMAGETMTMEQYLYAAMLPSANEAAMTIAAHISGTQADFAKLMNKRAKELGATNTSFQNATGLYDKEHLTTARDMALITEAALEFEEFRTIMGTFSYEIPPTNKHPEGIFLESTIVMQDPNSPLYYAPLAGVKTGTLPESGRCFISTAEKDGFRYLLVLFGSELDVNEYGVIGYDNRAFAETRAIYDWVFGHFQLKTILESNIIIGEIPVQFSAGADSVQIVTADYLTALLPDDVVVSGEGANIRQNLEISSLLDAPVEKGAPVGEVIVELNGLEIGRVPLVTAARVESSGFKVAVHKLRMFARGFSFKFIVVYLVLLVLAYMLLMRIRNRNKQRRKGSPRSRHY